MAGRKRKPEALKKLEGTFRKDRNQNIVSVPAGIPNKPEWAEHDPIASALYDQVATHCYGMGVGTEVDAIGFALLSDQLSMYLRLRALVNSEGLMVESEGSQGQTIGPRRLWHAHIDTLSSRPSAPLASLLYI